MEPKVRIPFARSGAVDKRRRDVTIDRLLLLLLPVGWGWRWGWRLTGLLWTRRPVSYHRHPHIGVVEPSSVVVTAGYADRTGYRSRECGNGTWWYGPCPTAAAALITGVHPWTSKIHRNTVRVLNTEPVRQNVQNNQMCNRTKVFLNHSGGLVV